MLSCVVPSLIAEDKQMSKIKTFDASSACCFRHWQNAQCSQQYTDILKQQQEKEEVPGNISEKTRKLSED